MPAVYEAERCRGARLPWKDCDRAVTGKVPLADIKENHTGVRVRCSACGTSNFIRQGEPTSTNDQREATQG